jgi:hypothetical protein
MSHEYGNGVAIFTRDGDAARDFAARVNIGMVGINVPIPVPLAYYTFGGWKRSGFGDLNQHGPDAFRFYTRTKTITSRWPSGIKEGAEFVIPTMNAVEAFSDFVGFHVRLSFCWLMILFLGGIKREAPWISSGRLTEEQRASIIVRISILELFEMARADPWTSPMTKIFILAGEDFR